MGNDNLGKKAKLRRIVASYDTVLSIIDDDRALGDHDFYSQSVRELIQDTLKARMCAANILLTYGDDTAHKSQPTLNLSIQFNNG